MSTRFKVSICVPTCNRPGLIVQCIESCLAQTYQNIEILIGDDSSDSRTEDLIRERYAQDPRVSYSRNPAPLGHARNVTSLFRRASGDKILLVHDRHYLVDTCIDHLIAVWEQHPDLEVAFGDQYEVSSGGHIDRHASARLNTALHRTANAQGLQPLPGRVGLSQMFPESAWLANADLVKRIGYNKQYRSCSEFVFGVELCMAAHRVYYLHEYVSCGHKAEPELSAKARRRATGASSVAAYAFVRGLTLDRALEPARKQALRRLVPVVVSACSRNRSPAQGLRIAMLHLFAYNYGFSMRLYLQLMMLSRAAIVLRARRGKQLTVQFPAKHSR
jgi:hypothetical protein